MIRSIPFQEIDKTKWDQCVYSSENASIYGLYDSISVACDNWIGLVLNDYEAVMALPIKKKLGLSYSWHPQFMGPLGIFSTHTNAEAIKSFYEELIRHSWWIRMYYWEKENHVGSIKPTLRIFQGLDLSGTIETIRKNYNENTSRNIKKALKSGLEIKTETDVLRVIHNFKEFKGGEIKNITEESYHLLQKLMRHWQETGNALIKSVYYQNQLAAIGYFIHWKDKMIYYKGVVTSEGKNLGAMHLLIDAMIETAVANHSFFDFGGSNTESVARFYHGFGGVDHSYYEHEYKKFKI